MPYPKQRANKRLVQLRECVKACSEYRTGHPAYEYAVALSTAPADEVLREFEAKVIEPYAKDAARYRYLRDAKQSGAPHGSLVELWLFSRPTGGAFAIDTSIDEAIRALLPAAPEVTE